MKTTSNSRIAAIAPATNIVSNSAEDVLLDSEIRIEVLSTEELGVSGADTIGVARVRDNVAESEAPELEE